MINFILPMLSCLCLLMLNYFNWGEISLLSQNASYLTSVINWEDLSYLYLNDLFFPLRTLFHIFFSFFWSTNTITYSSLLSQIFITTGESLFLFNAFFLDMFVFVMSTTGLDMSFTFSHRMDLVLIMPELIFFF
uniref:ORF134 n=1 Tax=Euplotes crassus TaxID=5936 RepID=D1LDS2_EUPCR|nr:ORF134 [Moneuplotes crassus]